MAKRTNNEIEQFRRRVEDLKDKGYVPLMGYASMPRVSNIPESGRTEVGKEMMGSTSSIGGPAMKMNANMFNAKQSAPKAVPGNREENWLGYIPWGPQDNLPNQIYIYANSLPYTASALRYLIDSTVALGPKLMYRFTAYQGGTVVERKVPYEDAGLLLLGKMREVASRIASREAEMARTQADGEGGGERTISWGEAVNMSPSGSPSQGSRQGNGSGTESASDKVLEMDRKEMEQLEADYAEWQRTMEDVKPFLENNNLESHFQSCMTDQHHLDIYFPTYGLSVGRRAPWRPKIVRVGYIPSVCARMEEMDEQWKVNHIFYSEKWRNDTTAKLEQRDVVAYPCLDANHVVAELRETVRRNQNVPMAKRPLWFCAPSKYPSMLRPYYPQAAWWSIFTSQAYSYASTLIYDKAVARENSTMWGKIIYINLSYLKSMYDQMGADTDDKKDAVKNQIYESVNAFLKRRSNNGKTLILDSFLSTDEKTLWKSVEIVDVPQVSSGADTKDELEEISSIIFFALGIHPALIGAVPGKSGSSGGTYQRELKLLKQQQLTPIQRIYLRYLQNICIFNEWDPHAEWVIREQVLTTLDRSSTGTEESTTTI